MMISDEERRNECAGKREMRRKRTMEEYDNYCGTTVECVELIDVEVPSRKSRRGKQCHG